MSQDFCLFQTRILQATQAVKTQFKLDKNSSSSNSIFQTRYFKILVQIDTAPVLPYFHFMFSIHFGISSYIFVKHELIPCRRSVLTTVMVGFVVHKNTDNILAKAWLLQVKQQCSIVLCLLKLPSFQIFAKSNEEKKFNSA